jgi:hypothetical protein
MSLKFPLVPFAVVTSCNISSVSSSKGNLTCIYCNILFRTGGKFSQLVTTNLCVSFDVSTLVILPRTYSKKTDNSPLRGLWANSAPGPFPPLHSIPGRESAFRSVAARPLASVARFRLALLATSGRTAPRR